MPPSYGRDTELSSAYVNANLYALASKEALEVSCHLEPVNWPTLPTEILELIFANVQYVEHMGSISLVCRRWRAVMARQMWATLVASFKPTVTTKRSPILDPLNTSLSHIRRLIVRKIPQNRVGSCEEKLRLLLEYIPQGTLKHFITRSPLSPGMFKELVQLQGGLESFDGYITPVVSAFQRRDWVLPYLSKLKFYRMVIKDVMRRRSLKIHEILFHGMSGLESLHICYEYRHIPMTFGHAYVDVRPAFGGDIRFPRLKNLSLCGVDMTCNSKLSLDRFDVSKLRTLELVDCIGAAPFFNNLSDWYSGNMGTLHTSHFAFPRAWEMTDEEILHSAIERFLMVCPTLRYLRLEHWRPPLVRVACITRHSVTLQGLALAAHMWPEVLEMDPSTYSAQDLETILKKCQNLSTLGTNMPFKSVDLGSVHDLGCRFELTRQRLDEALALPEFKNTLSIIAQHPNLHRLRMLNLPQMQYSSPINFSSVLKPITDEDASKCQALMQKFASEVFRFLAERNSSVQFLDVHPLLKPPVPPRPDENNHQWPIYAYRAHSVRLEGRRIGWMQPCAPYIVSISPGDNLVFP